MYKVQGLALRVWAIAGIFGVGASGDVNDQGP